MSSVGRMINQTPLDHVDGSGRFERLQLQPPREFPSLGRGSPGREHRTHEALQYRSLPAIQIPRSTFAADTMTMHATESRYEFELTEREGRKLTRKLTESSAR